MLNDQVDTSTLEPWCQRLDEHPLPVLPSNAHALQKALKQTDVALHDLGSIIAADPVMTLHLLRECQRQFGKRVEGSLTNVHHCVAMLGLDKTLALASTFQPLPDPLTNHTPYLEALGCSLHGAEQVRQWMRFRHGSSADQAYMAALLLGVLDAALWHSAPNEMHALNVLTTQEAIPAPEADLAVLGCTRPQLARALAERWHFPASVLDAINPLHWPEPRFLVLESRHTERDPRHKLPNKDGAGHLIRTQGLYVQLARQIAQCARQDWYSIVQQRCHSVLAACLFIPPHDARQLTMDTAIDLSRDWPIPLAAPPAVGLIWPLQPRQRRRLAAAQLPKVVEQLLAGKTLPSTKAAPTTPKPAARPVAPAPSPAPATTRRSPPPSIGLTSNNLPTDLDRSSILNAPPPSAPPAAPQHLAGFTSLAKKQAFELFIHRLLTEPDYYSTEYEVIRAVVEQLHDSTELSRVVVALHNPKLEQIEGYFALGCEQYPALKRYRVKLQPVNLFTHLLKQPAGLWLSPERPNKASGLIPGSFKQANQTDTCFLMSAFNHKGAYAMFYADRGVNDRLGLSEHEYKIFKTACTACSKHLIAKGKRAAAKRP